MKLCNKNYDIEQFGIGRTTRLLVLLRLQSYTKHELCVSYQDIVRLWLQHRLGSHVDTLKQRLAPVKRIASYGPRLLLKLFKRSA